MKNTEVSPTFKKNDDMIKNNDKPVSILSVFSKIFQTIVSDELMEYFKCIFNYTLCAYRTCSYKIT